MSFTLRLARLEDIPALNHLIPLSARELQTQHYTKAQIEGAIGTVFGVDAQLIRDGTYFVAESEGVIAGCGGWSRRKTLFGADAGRQGELRWTPRTMPPASGPFLYTRTLPGAALARPSCWQRKPQRLRQGSDRSTSWRPCPANRFIGNLGTP